MGKDLICPHCGEAELEYITGAPPYNPRSYLQCPKCDSTYASIAQVRRVNKNKEKSE
jgi:hypothetical protein